MRKLLNPTSPGGIPFQNEDILFLANENFDSLKQILVGVGDSFVLSGCKVLAQDNINRTCTLSGGYVWLDNAVQAVEQYSGTYPFYIKSAPAVFTKKTLQIGTQANVYADYNAITVTAKPNTNCITCNPEPEFRFSNLITDNVRIALENEIATRQQQINDEISIRTLQINQLNTALGLLSDKVNTKVTAKIGGSNWIDLDFTNYPAFKHHGVSGIQKAQYKRTEDGFVHFRGFVEIVGNQGGNFQDMPSGFQPSDEVGTILHSRNGIYKVNIYCFYGSMFAIPIQMGNSNDKFFSLNGWSYYASGSGGVI